MNKTGAQCATGWPTNHLEREKAIMEMLKKRVNARGQGGFTLIELLVVIAILAILAGVVVFAVGNSTDNAKVSSCKTELAAVKTAIAAAETSNQVNDAANQET